MLRPQAVDAKLRWVKIHLWTKRILENLLVFSLAPLAVLDAITDQSQMLKPLWIQLFENFEQVYAAYMLNQFNAKAFVCKG